MMKRTLTALFVAALLLTAASANAAITTYTNLTAWQNAVDLVSDDVRLIDFSGFTHGTQVGNAELGPGVVFRKFEGIDLYPRVDNDSPFGGGWLTNRNNAGFDEFGDGFVFDFTEPVIAISLNDNPFEANRLRIYNALDQLIGEVSNGTGQDNFLGLISDQPIAYATVINLPPEDGVFAMDNLRVAVQTIPEPTTFAVLGMLSLLGLRRRNA